jgi:hypothetical protein
MSTMFPRSDLVLFSIVYRLRRCLTVSFVVGFFLASAGVSLARTPVPSPATHWRGQTNSNWSGQNWASNASGSNTSLTPTSSSSITFSAAGATNAVTLDVNATVAVLTVNDLISINGTNTLTVTGTTSVTATGTLFNNATLASTVTAASGATLGGSGTYSGLTTLSTGAHLAPGNSPGTTTFSGGLTLNDGAILDLELGTGSDLILVSGGTLTGSAGAGGITVNLTDSGGFAAGTYDLIDGTGSTLSGFEASDFAIGTGIVGYDFDFFITNDILQLVAVAAIPEPSNATVLVAPGYRHPRRHPPSPLCPRDHVALIVYSAADRVG